VGSRKAHTRRDFLRGTVGAAAGASLIGLGGCFPDVGGSWAALTAACVDEDPVVPVTEAGRVVEVVREDSVLQVTDPGSGAGRLEVQAAAMRPMLDAALAALTDGAAQPWSVLLPEVGAATRIGIKVNCLNQQLPTSVALVRALVDSLREGLGITPDRLVVWDRRLDELTLCGFTAESVGAPVRGTVNSITDGGGPGYTAAICGVVEGQAPRFSRILTDLTDLTINCPVLKTHRVSGVTAAFKNIYGIIDNPGDYHDNLVTALPALYRLPPIRRAIRLSLCDALLAVTRGGTSDPPDATPRRVLLARDPLALDRYALDLVNGIRATAQPPLGAVDAKVTGWLQGAADLGLGSLQYELQTITQ
jgi:hypothetical protein